MPGGNIAKFQALASAVAGTVGVVKSLDAAVQSLGKTISTTAPAMGAALAKTGETITQVAQGIRDVQGEWQQSQIDMLERLKNLVIPFEGSDAGSRFSFDKIIEDQIAKIKSGEETAQQAIQELQRQFGSVYGTLQRTFFGSQDPATREFLLELENFINSGRLNG